MGRDANAQWTARAIFRMKVGEIAEETRRAAAEGSEILRSVRRRL